MTGIEMEKARDRVHTLRSRLSDTNHLLETISRDSHVKDEDTRSNLRSAATTIQTVIDDLESVCSDHLIDPNDNRLQQSALQRAESEVNSGEFDSQG